MSTIRLTEAPLKEPLLLEDGTLDKVWLQYFGDLQDSTAGYWGKGLQTVKLNGVTTAATNGNPVNSIQFSGQKLSLYLKFNELTTVSATCVFSDKYRVLDDSLKMTEVDSSGNVISISWVYVKDSQFTIPDMSTTNTVIISGELIKKLGD